MQTNEPEYLQYRMECVKRCANVARRITDFPNVKLLPEIGNMDVSYYFRLFTMYTTITANEIISGSREKAIKYAARLAQLSIIIDDMYEMPPLIE